MIEKQPQNDTPALVWFKSSFSNNGGDCVEVSCTLLDTKGVLLVRDSKNPDSGQLSFTPAEWTAFVKGAAAGEFNLKRQQRHQRADVPSWDVGPRASREQRAPIGRLAGA